MHTQIQDQFDTRRKTFNISANWIGDKRLANAHVDIAGVLRGRALELCCGTGKVGKAFVAKGWDLVGIDISKEMVREAGKYFPVLQEKAEELPFRDGLFSTVIMRQAYFFLDTKKVLKEIKRVLKNNGVFILSQTVPFGEKDTPWLRKIHLAKQAQLRKFYTGADLQRELEQNGFRIPKKVFLTVRENITRWMKYAPELTEAKKKEVSNMILNSPPDYKEIRDVKQKKDGLFEDWNWVVFRAVKQD